MDRSSPSSKTLTYLAGLGGADASGSENLSRHNRQKPAMSPSSGGANEGLVQRIVKKLNLR